MNDIVKATIRVTILGDASSLNGDMLSGLSLKDIGYEIDEGDWLGLSEIEKIEPIDPALLDAECKALGNDGTFFNVLED